MATKRRRSHTDAVDTDIWTPIAAEIGVPIEIMVE
jgi:hypothetical protein